MKKKIILSITISLNTLFCFSQNIFPTNVGTNVGIGTSAPSTRLQITSSALGSSGLRLTNLTSASPTTLSNNKALSVDGTGNIVLTPVINSLPITTNLFNSNGTLTSNRTLTMPGFNLTFNPTATNSAFFINGTSGNVGIGTLSPNEKLEIAGVMKAVQGEFTNSQPNGSFFTDYNDRNIKCSVINAGALRDLNDKGRILRLLDFPQSNLDTKSSFFFGIEDRDDNGRFRVSAYTGGATYMGVLNKSQENVFAINEDGLDNVTVTLPKSNSFLGIGTNSFSDGVDLYRLSVKGAIRADRVKVYTSWADFVFEKNYILPKLEEVEEYIGMNGCLMNIPSAKEVEKNGIELGEMNKKLLQKIEELTLYLIELNKEVNKMKIILNK